MTVHSYMHSHNSRNFNEYHYSNTTCQNALKEQALNLSDINILLGS